VEAVLQEFYRMEEGEARFLHCMRYFIASADETEEKTLKQVIFELARAFTYLQTWSGLYV
jgi:hypothetical protein